MNMHRCGVWGAKKVLRPGGVGAVALILFGRTSWACQIDMSSMTPPCTGSILRLFLFGSKQLVVVDICSLPGALFACYALHAFDACVLAGFGGS